MVFLQKMKAKNFKRRGAKHYEVVYSEASISQLSLIDSLLRTINLPIQYQEEIENKTKIGITEGEATELIEYLLDNQIDPVHSGLNYSAKDIINNLKRLK